MNFTNSVYRKARSRAMNEVYSRADILEWAKSSDDRLPVEEARTEYFKSLERVFKIVARGRREKGLWR